MMGVCRRRAALFGSLILLVLSAAAGCSRDAGHGRVRVAALLPLTGPAATIGEDEKLGIELAIADTPNADALAEFVFEDSQSKPDVTVSALRKQLDVDGTGVFMITTTGPVQAALPALRDSNRDVFAVVAATMPGITGGFPFAYRIYPTANEEVATIAGYANAKGYRTVAAFAPRVRVGEESLKLLTAQMNASGGKVTLAETFEPTEKDFRSAIAKIKDRPVDAIVVTGAFPSQYVPILKQMAEAGVSVPVLCGVAIALTGAEKELPPAFVGLIKFVAPPFYFNADVARTRAFERQVVARGRTPSYEVAYAYDSATMILQAIRGAVGKTPSAIAATFSRLSPFDGLAGAIVFTSDRDAVLGFRMAQWGPDGRVGTAK